MKRLGYRPHALARGLAARRSDTLGLVITDILDPYFAEIVRGAQAQAEAAGYMILLADTSVDPSREELLVNRLLERRVDGLIVASSRTTRSYAALVKAAEIPLVCINGRRDLFPQCIQTDNLSGAKIAMEHLLQLGHQRIGHIMGPPGVPTRNERVAGYRAALNAAKIDYDSQLVAAGWGRLEESREAARTLLSTRDSPTAIFAYNDRSAIGCYQAIRAMGLRVGADVSVVGFDDILMASWVDPGLTTVSQPRREMGRVAVEVLLGTLRGESAPAQVIVAPRLVERESTARLGQR